MRAITIRKSRRVFWLVLISLFVYAITLLIHYVYTHYFNPNYKIIISDQVVFFNRGMGILIGEVPYRDFYVNAAPLSSYLWAPFVLVSMISASNFSTSFVTVENYFESSSMMILSYVFRIFFAFCIIVSGVILYKLEEKRNNKHAFLISLLYTINPFFLHLNSFWGSDECIVPLLILLPIYLYERGKKTIPTLIIILGAGLKYFPILITPLILIYCKNWKERIIQTLIFLLGIATIVLPLYLLAPTEFIFQFQDNITAPGNEGILTVIQEFFNISIEHINYIFPIMTVIGVGIVGFALFLRRKEWSYHQTVSLLLVFLIFYQKMQISYLAMIVPFLFVGFFAKGYLKLINIGVFLFGIFEGYFASQLIKNSLEKIVWRVLSWIEVSIFYVLMILLLLIYSIKYNNTLAEQLFVKNDVLVFQSVE